MEQKPLIADVMLGWDITDCLVLASHPDERRSPDGRRPSLTRRTIVMSFDGCHFRGATSLPVALHRGWSSDNGSGYCTPIRGHQVYVHAGGQWQREQFSDQDEDVLRIWGLSGGDSQADLVCISTDGALFLRREGKWTRHAPPEPARRVFGVNGRSPDELYVCSDTGLLIWTGSGFQEIEDRPKPVVKAILVCGDEIYAGDDYLLHWTQASGWQRWQPTVPDVTALLEVDGAVVAGTFEKGVMERQGASFVPMTPAFMCLELQRIGDGAFAYGDNRGYIRVEGRWQEFVLPMCAVGQLPQDAS